MAKFHLVEMYFFFNRKKEYEYQNIQYKLQKLSTNGIKWESWNIVACMMTDYSYNIRKFDEVIDSQEFNSSNLSVEIPSYPTCENTFWYHFFSPKKIKIQNQLLDVGCKGISCSQPSPTKSSFKIINSYWQQVDKVY